MAHKRQRNGGLREIARYDTAGVSVVGLPFGMARSSGTPPAGQHCLLGRGRYGYLVAGSAAAARGRVAVGSRKSRRRPREPAAGGGPQQARVTCGASIP